MLRLVFTLSFIACLLFAGCGPQRPARVKVSGQVLVNGQPLKTGYIRMQGKDDRPSGGEIDGEGYFTLTSYSEKDGVVPGPQRVEISSNEIKGQSLYWYTPREWADMETSGIAVTIDESTDSLLLELTTHVKLPIVEKILE